MKKLSFLAVSAVVLMAFSGCSKLADSLTVKVPVEATIDLDVPAGGGDLKTLGGRVFFATDTYNTGTDPTVLEYKDRIKGIAADGGKAQISLVPPFTSITLTNTVLQVRDADTGLILIGWNFESKTYQNNAELTLGTPVSGSLDAFSTALDNGANLFIEFTGDSGSMREAWILRYTILMTVRAGIL